MLKEKLKAELAMQMDYTRYLHKLRDGMTAKDGAKSKHLKKLIEDQEYSVYRKQQKLAQM